MTRAFRFDIRTRPPRQARRVWGRFYIKSRDPAGGRSRGVLLCCLVVREQGDSSVSVMSRATAFTETPFGSVAPPGCTPTATGPPLRVYRPHMSKASVPACGMACSTVRSSTALRRFVASPAGDALFPSDYAHTIALVTSRGTGNDQKADQPIINWDKSSQSEQSSSSDQAVHPNRSDR